MITLFNYSRTWVKKIQANVNPFTGFTPYLGGKCFKTPGLCADSEATVDKWVNDHDPCWRPREPFLFLSPISPNAVGLFLTQHARVSFTGKSYLAGPAVLRLVFQRKTT